VGKGSEKKYEAEECKPANMAKSNRETVADVIMENCYK
jgi:hypothetical protein